MHPVGLTIESDPICRFDCCEKHLGQPFGPEGGMDPCRELVQGERPRAPARACQVEALSRVGDSEPAKRHSGRNLAAQ